MPIKHACNKYDDNNYNLLHVYSAFLATQSALHEEGESPQPPRPKYGTRSIPNTDSTFPDVPFSFFRTLIDFIKRESFF